MMTAPRPWIARWFRALALLFCLAAPIGCGGEKGGAPAPASGPPQVPGSILVIGIDGMEWGVTLGLLHQGKMPNLAKLMRRGRYGFLRSMKPTLSPVIWTTIATSKKPSEHGILNFVYRDAKGEERLYNRTNRRTKAIWNIYSDCNYRVAVIGYWNTWPVESINGLMVAQTNTLAEKERRRSMKGSLLRGIPAQVHPAARQEEMLAVPEAVERDLPELIKRIFGEFKHEMRPLARGLWESSLWSLRADETYARIAKKAAADKPYDLEIVYFSGTDVLGHRFWRYMEPHRYLDRPSEEEVEDLGRVIPRYYMYMDRVIGALVDSRPADTSVFILSDHGMKGWNFEMNYGVAMTPDTPIARFISGEHRGAPPGVLFAAGPWIEPRPDTPPPERLVRGDLESIGSVFDITPTLLALHRIPLGRDMRGSIMADLFRAEVRILDQPEAIESHDSHRAPLSPGVLELVDPAEAERIEQLKALGYLQGR